MPIHLKALGLTRLRFSKGLGPLVLLALCVLGGVLAPVGASAQETASATPATPLIEASAPTAPTLLTTDKISAGDTAWMLTSTALVLMMTIPGLALFYGGMVRKKNLLATLMQSFAIACLVTVLWWLVGYSIAFTPGGSSLLGGFGHSMMNGVPPRNAML